MRPREENKVFYKWGRKKSGQLWKMLKMGYIRKYIEKKIIIIIIIKKKFCYLTHTTFFHPMAVE